MAMPDRRLAATDLNRALLARQLLLERSEFSIPAAIGQVGGLQMQYAPSGYVGLWTRLASFQRDELTAALQDRTVIQATLMRGTIHLVPASDYWLYAIGVRRARREWWLRAQRGQVTEVELERRAEEMRVALASGPRSVKELGSMATGFVGNLGLWVDLVRVPPSGTWQRRRADILALAEDWVGPCQVTEEPAMEHMVRAYLRAFGPAPVRDIATWAGVPTAPLEAAAARIPLERHHDEHGRPLLDLPGAPLPRTDAPAPVRFLPHWDANLLVHARRTGVLPEAHRSRVFHVRNPFSVGTYLVDGRVAGAWSVKDRRVVLDAYEPLSITAREAVEAERERLEAFHA